MRARSLVRSQVAIAGAVLGASLASSSCILLLDYDYDEPTGAGGSGTTSGVASSSIASSSSSSSSASGGATLLELWTNDASTSGARLRVEAIAPTSFDGTLFALGADVSGAGLTLTPDVGPPITFGALLGGPTWIVGRWAADGSVQASLLETFTPGTTTALDVATDGTSAFYGLARPGVIEWGRLTANGAGVTRERIGRCTGPVDGVSVDVSGSVAVVATSTTNASQISCVDADDMPAPACAPGPQPGVGRDVAYWILVGDACERVGFVGDDCASNPTPGCDPEFDTTRPVVALSGSSPADVSHAWIGGSLRGPLAGTTTVGAASGSDVVVRVPILSATPTESSSLGPSSPDRPLVLGSNANNALALFSGGGNALDLHALGAPPSLVVSAPSADPRAALALSADPASKSAIVGGALGRCAPTLTTADRRGCAQPMPAEPTTTDSDGFWVVMDASGGFTGETFGEYGRNEITATARDGRGVLLGGLADGAIQIGGHSLPATATGQSRVFLVRVDPAAVSP